MGKRVIALVDNNCFYASVHQAINKNLRGKPVIVAGDPATRTGICLARSYECKQFAKITTGMNVHEAKALIPHAIFVKPRHDLYLDFSIHINKILETFTPLIEVFSIDEAFLDLTGSVKLFWFTFRNSQ